MASYAMQDNGSWFGMTDLEAFGYTEGTWGWINDKPVVYTNWFPGEPNNNENGDDCGELYASGQWNDANCLENQNYFVCNRPSLVHNIYILYVT